MRGPRIRLLGGRAREKDRQEILRVKKRARFLTIALSVGVFLLLSYGYAIVTRPERHGHIDRVFCTDYCNDMQGTLLEVNYTPSTRRPECVCAVYDHPFNPSERP